MKTVAFLGAFFVFFLGSRIVYIRWLNANFVPKSQTLAQSDEAYSFRVDIMNLQEETTVIGWWAGWVFSGFAGLCAAITVKIYQLQKLIENKPQPDQTVPPRQLRS